MIYLIEKAWARASIISSIASSLPYAENGVYDSCTTMGYSCPMCEAFEAMWAGIEIPV